MNGPWVLPILWNIVKVWLDQRTREKIVFVKGDVHDVLSKYIDDTQLPTEYGGRNNNGFTIKVFTNDELINDKTLVRKEQQQQVRQQSDSTNDGTEQVDIAAGSTADRYISSDAQRALYGYSIKLQSHDINVQIVYIHTDGTIDIVQHKQLIRDELNGEYQSKSNGTLKVILDNTHSYMRSKSVQINLSVADVDDTKAESDQDMNEMSNDMNNTTINGNEKNTNINGSNEYNTISNTDHSVELTDTISANNPAPIPDHVVAPVL